MTEGYVLIHDGVRMIVTPDLINKCIESAVANDACVAAVKVKDTIKKTTHVDEIDIVESTPDRNSLYQVQTPQCFEISLIKTAFNKLYSIPEEQRPVITDDAMPVELYTDHSVAIVEGDYRNIKITTPEDMELAGFWLKKQKD